MQMGTDTQSCKFWFSSCIPWCALWAFSTLHSQPWWTVWGGRGVVVLGSTQISTVSFPELNPTEAGRAKSSHCRPFAEWGWLALCEGIVGLWRVCSCRESPQIQHWLWLQMPPHALGTALDLISQKPTFAEPFLSHLTLAQTCWEY